MASCYAVESILCSEGEQSLAIGGARKIFE